jgi:16S rRNA (guanine966-N2)-methyltransferase
MRIVTGKLKGREIISPPKGIELRPTSDRVREAIFDVIRTEIEDVIFLDLFAGSGAMGIEALSEGASFALFIDKNSLAIKTIKHNIERLQLENQTFIIKDDAVHFLNEPTLPQGFNKKFHIVFLDPPYASKLAAVIVQKLTNFPLLHDKAIVIAEHSLGEKLEDAYTGGFTLKRFKEKEYGNIAVSYYLRE